MSLHTPSDLPRLPLRTQLASDTSELNGIFPRLFGPAHRALTERATGFAAWTFRPRHTSYVDLLGSSHQHRSC
jgi:hypothetical protein